MRRVALALVAVIGCFVIPTGAHAAGCGGAQTGLTAKTLKNEFGTVDVVDPLKVDVYTVAFSAGAHYIALQGAGEIDLYVCKGTETTVRCESNNPVYLDACAAEGLQDDPAPNFGIGNTVNGPGTFKIYVKHCLDDRTECGYPADSPAPIPYVLFVG